MYEFEVNFQDLFFRNYPLRLMQTLNVILFKSLDPDQESRTCAIRLLHLLDK